MALPSPLAPILDVLACPQCAGALEWQAENGGQGDDGWLHCASCARFTPGLSGILFFGEMASDIRGGLGALRARIGTQEVYTRYAEEKRARNVLEPYAAFAPFNESTRAGLPFLYGARDRLAPGDLVLDLSNRSGWTGAYLAGLFPQQRVIAFWEGDSSVLGYRGFAYWLGAANRPPNFYPVFLPPNSSLPVRNATARLIHGYDILHHRPAAEFLTEAVRVGTNDARLVFPHIHLSNSEPSPWFARGGTHRHGRDYQSLLESLVTDGRDVSVISELSAFDAWQETPNGAALPTAPDTPHYNGLISVMPPSVAASVARTTHKAACLPSSRFVSNPFLRINPFTGRVSLLSDALAGHLRHMFDRHPAYEAFLSGAIEGLVLSPGDLALLGAMEEGGSLSQLATNGLNEHDVLLSVRRLVAADLIVAAPVSPHIWRMQQHFHANGHSLFDGDAARLLKEWSAEAPEAQAFALMGVPLNRQEIGEISNALLDYFARHPENPSALRILSHDDKSFAWMSLLAAAAGWEVTPDASGVVSIKEDDLSISASGRSTSLADILEIYGAPDAQTAFGGLPPRRLQTRDILRIAAALA